MTPDTRWMRAALAEARLGEGQTRPNPPVGAMLVRDGLLLASGYHHAAGQPHAEVEALLACPANPAGSTLYVTLEPCSTHGRTPPCTERILAARIARVVIATVDPNPRHAGRGIDLLRRGGVEVSVGVLAKEADQLLAPFGHWITTGRPYVSLKMAQSLDGAIADSEGRSQWITGPQSRQQVQRLRRGADAVMVGVGTVLADNPSLLCRDPDAPPSLHRIVVDSQGRTPATATVLCDGQSRRTVMATTEACPKAVREGWEAAGATVWTLPQTPSGQVDLSALLERAGREGWLHVLCEGGATLAGALVSANLADALHVMVAPIILGARTASSFGSLPFGLPTAPRFRIHAQRRLGQDLWITATRSHPD